jgi:hypothetical protein
MGDLSRIFSGVPGENVVEVSDGGISSHFENTLEVSCRLLAGEARRLSVFQGGGIRVFGLFRDDAGGDCNQLKAIMAISSISRSEIVGRDGNGLVLPTITSIIVQLALSDTWKMVKVLDSRTVELHGEQCDKASNLVKTG